MEEELQKYNQKWLDLKILLEKENADVLGAISPISFDEIHLSKLHLVGSEPSDLPRPSDFLLI